VFDIVIRIFAFAVLVVSPVVLVSACQTTCDPHERVIFGGYRGVLSGCYEERAEKQKEAIRQELLKQQKEEQKAVEIHKENMLVQRKKKEAIERLAALAGSIRLLRRSLLKEEQRKSAEAAELRNVESELRMLEELRNVAVMADKLGVHVPQQRAEYIKLLTIQIERYGDMVEVLLGRKYTMSQRQVR
jgi:hypothetical protein